MGPTAHASAPDALRHLIEVWRLATESCAELLDTITDDEARLPTDLPGWDVHAVAAHVAHLEALLAGADHDDVAVGEVEHIRNPLGQVTEQGVVARRGRTISELADELRRSSAARHAAVQADPPTDPDAPAPGLFGFISWSTLTLLTNRPIDLAMHEQDIRRAVGRPGNLDHPAVVHTVDHLAGALGLVLSKRAGAPAGTVLTLTVDGHPTRAWQVGDDLRGREISPPPHNPNVALRCDRETFLVLAGGRRDDEATLSRVHVDGDEGLASAVLTHLNVTP